MSAVLCQKKSHSQDNTSDDIIYMINGILVSNWWLGHMNYDILHYNTYTNLNSIAINLVDYTYYALRNIGLSAVGIFFWKHFKLRRAFSTLIKLYIIFQIFSLQAVFSQRLDVLHRIQILTRFWKNKFFFINNHGYPNCWSDIYIISAYVLQCHR